MSSLRAITKPFKHNAFFNAFKRAVSLKNCLGLNVLEKDDPAKKVIESSRNWKVISSSHSEQIGTKTVVFYLFYIPLGIAIRSNIHAPIELKYHSEDVDANDTDSVVVDFFRLSWQQYFWNWSERISDEVICAGTSTISSPVSYDLLANCNFSEFASNFYKIMPNDLIQITCGYLKEIDARSERLNSALKFYSITSEDIRQL